MIETDLPDQFLYARQGPWPQPSPSHPLICADEVLHIPQMEELLFNQTIGLRYLKARMGYPAYAAQYAASVAGWTGVTPERFDTIMLDTIYTRFRTPLHPDETEALAKAFAEDPEILAELSSGAWYKYDFTAMDMVKPIPGTYSAGTKVFVRFDSDEDSATGSTRIISVRDTFIHRDDSSWGIANCYALQGAAYHVLFVVHPAIHFPMDSINAITKTSVPMGHPLFQLFLPHSTYSLPLDNAVLESSMSVVNNNAQGTRFDPLTADAYNLKLLFGAGYNGVTAEDNGPQYLPGAYPRYNYMKPHMYRAPGSKNSDPRDHLFNSEYGRWLGAYYEVFLEFCRAIATEIKADKGQLDYVKHWAKYCHNHVHGFPMPAEVAGEVEGHEDTLAEVMAIYTWNNSVSHGGDHWSFANQVSPVEKCLRIRRAPPTRRDEAPVDNAATEGGQIFSPNDMQRAALCQYMFFQAWAIEPNLAETQYAFTNPKLLAASMEFHVGLKKVNETFCKVLPEPVVQGGDSMAITTCMPLEPIPHPDKPGEFLVPYAKTLPQSIQY